MRTCLEGNRLIIRDQPFGFWLFYSFFVAGGSIALILSLIAAPDATTAIIGSVIGLGNIAGGLYMIKREPASIVEIDKSAAEIRVCQWYPVRKRQNTYPLSALSGAEVEITEHSEGGSVYRPRICFGKPEPLSKRPIGTTTQQVCGRLKRSTNRQHVILGKTSKVSPRCAA